MEDEIYSDKSIRVTNARIIIGNTTYALKNITSISTTETPPSTGGPVFFFFISSISLICGISWFFSDHDSTTPALILTAVSAIIMVLSFMYHKNLKPMYHLRITNTAGEIDALSSFNENYIATVVEKINEAIVKC